MNELAPEIQVAIIKAAHEASIENTNMKVQNKKGSKSFSQLYCESFAKNYRTLSDIVAMKPETDTEPSA